MNFLEKLISLLLAVVILAVSVEILWRMYEKAEDERLDRIEAVIDKQAKVLLATKNTVVEMHREELTKGKKGTNKGEERKP